MATVAANTDIADFESFSPKVRQRDDEGIGVFHCVVCNYPQVVSARQARRAKVCRSCSNGHAPEPKETYYKFWLDRFTRKELREMAINIWGRKK